MLSIKEEKVVFYGYCYGQNVGVPPDANVEALIPNVIVLADGAIGR